MGGWHSPAPQKIYVYANILDEGKKIYNKNLIF
jgi:hypothetical protein